MQDLKIIASKNMAKLTSREDAEPWRSFFRAVEKSSSVNSEIALESCGWIRCINKQRLEYIIIDFVLTFRLANVSKCVPVNDEVNI